MLPSVSKNKMTCIGPEERKNDHSWKILNTSVKKYDLRNRNRRRTQSYEKFIEDKTCSHELNATPPTILQNIPDHSLSTRELDDNAETLDGSSDNDEDEWISQSESSSDDATFAKPKVKSNLNVHRPGAKANKDKPDVLSQPSNDEELDAFIKILSEDLKGSENVAHENRHYTNLTDYMLRVDRTDRNHKSGKPTTTIPFSHDEGNTLHNDTCRLSLEQKLPLLQVLDTIGDINKILKDGALTPRMERVMEYKQDHPFRYGYEEEKMGCCPWLVHKFENMFRRFLASQWPYN